MELTALLGRTVVDTRHRVLGRMHDVLVRLERGAAPPVVGLVVRDGGKEALLPVSRLSLFVSRSTRAVLVAADGAQPTVARGPDEVLLEREVRDQMVIDLAGGRAARVNEVLLGECMDGWRAIGVDLDPDAMVRRMLPRLPRRRAAGSRLVAWEALELLACDSPNRRLRPDHRRLARLHPADIARVADELTGLQAAEVLASLPEALAAAALAGMALPCQTGAVLRLDAGRAAAIVQEMGPDAGADLLAALPAAQAERLLWRLPPTHGAAIAALMAYPPHSAGGLMTTRYLAAPPWLRTGEAARYLREQLEGADDAAAACIYVVEGPHSRRLLGTLSPRDLLLAHPDQRLDELMRPVPVRVGPEDTAGRVARTMLAYRLASLPVTDAEGLLLGVIVQDAAARAVAPPGLWRG